MRATKLLFLCVFLFAVGVVNAQNFAGDSDQLTLTAERPDPAGTATPVKVGIFILDIDSVDDVEQRFNVDFFARLDWDDPRLAIPPEQRKGLLRNLSLDEIWTPRLLIINDRGLDVQLPMVVEVDDLGHVVYRQRLTGTLAADLLFKEFPFDRQLLPIDLVSYQYSPDEIEFLVNADISGGDGSYSAEGWAFSMLEPSTTPATMPGNIGELPQYAAVVAATRDSQYYLLTMFLPMTLIVFMAWTVFWLPPDIIPSRIAISTASIFSLIAFGFSIRLSLPPVAYMTKADIFVLGSTLLVFLALGVAVIGSRWASTDRMERALQLNSVARWIYWLLFAVVLLISLT